MTLSKTVPTELVTTDVTPVAHHGGARPAIVVAALGIVFGDIGTSPLYAFKETLNPDHGIALTHATVLGCR
jgi:KUP system potassium uptake protein